MPEEFQPQQTLEQLIAQPSAPAAEQAPPTPAAQPAPQSAAPSFGQPSTPAGGQPAPRQVAPAVPGQAAPQQQAPAQGQLFSAREYLREQGYSTDQFPDERSAVIALTGLARQAQQIPQIQPYANLGQRYWNERERIDAFLAQKQVVPQAPAPQQQPQSPAARGPQKPDNYNPQWEQFMRTDPTTGMKVGVTADIPAQWVNACNAQLDWSRNRIQEVLGGWESPAEIEKRVMEQARAMMQDQFQTYQQQQQQQYEQQQAEQTIRSVIQNNSEWIYQKNVQGQVLHDFNNNPMLTQEGSRYKQIVQALELKGLNDPVTCDMFARHFMSLEQQQAGQQQPGLPAPNGATVQQARQDAFLKRNGSQHSPNRVAAALDPTLPPSPARSTFLLEALKEHQSKGNHVSAEDFAAASGGLLS